MANLKRVGVDMENAIFNDLKAVFTNLQCLRNVKHIGDRDKIKLDKLLSTLKADHAQKATIKSEIIADIYGKNNGSVYELGLSEAVDSNDFDAKLLSLERRWDSMYLGFFHGFEVNGGIIFVSVSFNQLAQVQTWLAFTTKMTLNRCTKSRN